MKKKILHLLASNKFSGAENVVCTIIENFRDKYKMAYCSPSGTIKEALEQRNIKYYEMSRFNVKELNLIIKKYKPDVIHAHDYRASVLAAFSNFEGKIISHLHNNCPFATKWNFKTLLYSYTSKKYANVIGVSERVFKEAIFKNKIIDKYITIYNYVDPNKIVKLSNEYSYKKYYDLFFIGRLTKQKDPFLFIKIVNRVKEYKRDVKAVIIGDGELYDKCTELINLYNLKDNIDMLGFVENPFPIIKKSKIGVMPSNWEGFGLTAIESIILGKCVLNSGVGGLGEIFKENSSLICKNVDDYVDMIKKIDNGYDIDLKNIISHYCDMEKWYSLIEQIYQ